MNIYLIAVIAVIVIIAGTFVYLTIQSPITFTTLAPEIKNILVGIGQDWSKTRCDLPTHYNSFYFREMYNSPKHGTYIILNLREETTINYHIPNEIYTSGYIDIRPVSDTEVEISTGKKSVIVKLSLPEIRVAVHKIWRSRKDFMTSSIGTDTQ